mgnify:CR=1 FL=1
MIHESMKMNCSVDENGGKCDDDDDDDNDALVTIVETFPA